MHASSLIRQLAEIRPEIQFEGFGGRRMEAAGCRLHADILHLAGMGFSFLQNIMAFVGLLRRFYKLTRDHPPDALVLVDFPGFNFLLARLAKLQGVPVVYYICPQIWAWAPWRRKKILRLTDLLMAIFPFEVDFYGGADDRVVYVGHPLADALAEVSDPDAMARNFRKAHEINDEDFVVGVFPGSRDHEVTSLMPFYRKTLERLELNGKSAVMVSCCRDRYRSQIEEQLGSLSTPATIVDGDARPLMAACDVALVASGTATLELAFFEKPMMVSYRVNRRDYWIYRFICTSPFVSLVNILAQRRVVPEEVTYKDSASDLNMSQLKAFVNDEAARESCREELRGLKEDVFQPGGSRTAAETLVRFLEERS